ncbi:hypothetical protein C8J57DRAFT_1016745, partial [Mycena rebaudengoi]
CRGLELTFPANQNHHVAYPFGLHAQIQLPWNYYLEGDHFYVRSISCRRKIHQDSTMCENCHKLRSNNALQGISERIIEGVNENTPLMFFPIGGLVSKMRRKNDQIQVMRLSKHNDTQTLASQSTSIDRHKEFMMAVASGKVTR